VAQKKRCGFQKIHAIMGAVGVAAVVGILLALTYLQPQRHDIVQDQPEGVTGSQAGSLPYQADVPSNEGDGTRNATGIIYLARQ
jgi:hypothetical protein